MNLMESDIGGLASSRARDHSRRDPRSRLFGPAYLVLPDHCIRVRIMNLSLAGALLHCPENIYTRFEGRLISDYIDRPVGIRVDGLQVPRHPFPSTA